MRPAPSIALAAALLAAPAFAASDVLSQASRADKGILVLQVGSDWCVSGEDVRKAFESDAFRRAVGSKFVLAVHDEKERMDDATKAANKLVAPALVKTKRFPALTLVTPQPFRFYAQIENIPSTVTGEKLAAAVKMLTKRKDEAEALFKKGASLAAARKDSEAADAYGAAFDILERQVGDFNAAQLRKGSLAYAYEWKALSDLDAGDRVGWVKHFELDVYKTVALVEKLTAAKSDGSGGAKEMVQNMKAVPDAHFSPNQRQFVKVLEYALTSEGTDKPLSPHEKDLMIEGPQKGGGAPEAHDKPRLRARLRAGQDEDRALRHKARCEAERTAEAGRREIRRSAAHRAEGLARARRLPGQRPVHQGFHERQGVARGLRLERAVRVRQVGAGRWGEGGARA